MPTAHPFVMIMFCVVDHILLLYVMTCNAMSLLEPRLHFICSKVKVLFTFTKAGGNRSEDDTKKLLQVKFPSVCYMGTANFQIAIPCCHSYFSLFCHRNCLHYVYICHDVVIYLKVFGASDEDKKALKFWMTGLSSQYRHHMRLTSKQL